MNLREYKRYSILFGTVLAVHIIAVFGPAGCYSLQKKQHENDDIPFKVKLGGFEPSHAPEIGEPERVRPNPDANVPPPPAPEPEPEPAPAPEPEPVPVPSPQPDEAQKKAEQQALLKKKAEEQRKQRELQQKKAEEIKRKKEIEKKKQQKLAELKRRQELEKKKQQKLAELKRKKELEKKKQQALAERKRRQDAERKRKLEAERRKKAESEVFHDNKWDNWDPNKPATAPGGKNFNKNVKIGSKDRGQKIGPVDGKTPAGGANSKTDNYIKGISETIHRQWRPPAGVFVTAETAVEITVSISRDGSVNCWISKRSSNPAVNRSAEDLISKLKQLPRPPEAVRFTIRLIQEY